MAYLEKVTLGSDEVKAHGRSHQYTKQPVTLTPGQGYTFDAPGYITLANLTVGNPQHTCALLVNGAMVLASVRGDTGEYRAVYAVPGLEYGWASSAPTAFEVQYWELVID